MIHLVKRKSAIALPLLKDETACGFECVTAQTEGAVEGVWALQLGHSIDGGCCGRCLGLTVMAQRRWRVLRKVSGPYSEDTE